MDAPIKRKVRENTKIGDYLRLNLGTKQRKPYETHPINRQKVG
jgi:hypothetical protein